MSGIGNRGNTSKLLRDSGILSLYELDPSRHVVVPDNVERRSQLLPAKDDTVTPIARRAPKRFALKPMAGW
jgi:hypothetical protein